VADLAPGPGERTAPDGPNAGDKRAPAYTSSIERVPSALGRRMTGSSHDPTRCPVKLADLRLLTMRYVGFDRQPHIGQMVVHRRHARDIVDVFQELYDERFPIRRMQLVDAYGGDDNRSMAADNTSAYNCRAVAGTSTFSGPRPPPVANSSTSTAHRMPTAPAGSSSRTTWSYGPSRGSAGNGAVSGTRPTTSTSTRRDPGNQTGLCRAQRCPA
jgi:hypothetical protein